MFSCSSYRGGSRGEDRGARPHPLICRPNWGQNSRKKFFWRLAPAYLRVWMTAPPPSLSEGLDPLLSYRVLFQSFFPQDISLLPKIVTEAHANLKKRKTSCMQHYFEALCSHGQVHPFRTFESFQSDLLAGSIFSIYSSSIRHQSSYGL